MRRIFAIIILACVMVSSMQAKSVPQPENPSAACAEAWKKYQKADALSKTGWGLFGAGLGVGIAGSVLYPIGAFGASSEPGGNAAGKRAAISGITLLCVGSGAVVASIPCLAVGYTKRKAALKEYQDKCGEVQQLSFYLQSSSNGVGLAMRF